MYVPIFNKMFMGTHYVMQYAEFRNICGPMAEDSKNITENGKDANH
jgi:hypothetical protein